MKAGGAAYSLSVAAVLIAAVIGSHCLCLNRSERLVTEALDRSMSFGDLGSQYDFGAGNSAASDLDVPTLAPSGDGKASNLQYFPSALQPDLSSSDREPDESDQLFAQRGMPRPLSFPGYVRLADSGELSEDEDNDRSVPEQLTLPENAAPLRPRRDARDQSARAIIEQELPEASDDERTMWFESLREVPADQIRDLLRIRRQIGDAGVIQPPGRARIILQPRTQPNPAPIADPGKSFLAVDQMPGQNVSASSVNKLQSAIAAITLAREVVVNNIANANTVAFKRSTVRLTDLPYTHLRSAGERSVQGRFRPASLSVGLGTRAAGTEIDFRDGDLVETGKPLDVAIAGEGFFQIKASRGIVYCRAGTFSIGRDGTIVLPCANGDRPLEPAITVPADSLDISISAEGSVSVLLPGSSHIADVGQIELAHFVNPSGLMQLGDGLYAATDASGKPCVATPGTDGQGVLRQGFLEWSNVDTLKETVELRRLTSELQAISHAMQVMSPDWKPVPHVDAGIARETQEERSPSRFIRRQSFAPEPSDPPAACSPELPPCCGDTECQKIECELSVD